MRYSVIIPAYKCQAYLGEAIESVLAQTLPASEVLVIDDGSPDDGYRVAQSFGTKVKLIRQTNQGVSAARNTGIRAATGDWLAFLDGDDVWEPAKLARIDELLRSSTPDHVCVLNDRYYLSDGTRGEIEPANIGACQDRFHVEMLKQLVSVPSCFAVRADVAGCVLFPVGVRNGEDQQFLLLVRRHGRFLHLREPLTGYRVWPGQASAEANHILIGVRVRSHLALIEQHADWYSPEERMELNCHFGNCLILAHRNAYWRRDNARARECRELYYALCPTSPAIPPLFDRPLYPRWLTWIKDQIDRVRGRRSLNASS